MLLADTLIHSTYHSDNPSDIHFNSPGLCRPWGFWTLPSAVPRIFGRNPWCTQNTKNIVLVCFDRDPCNHAQCWVTGGYQYNPFSHQGRTYRRKAKRSRQPSLIRGQRPVPKRHWQSLSGQWGKLSNCLLVVVAFLSCGVPVGKFKLKIHSISKSSCIRSIRPHFLVMGLRSSGFANSRA